MPSFTPVSKLPFVKGDLEEQRSLDEKKLVEGAGGEAG